MPKITYQVTISSDDGKAVVAIATYEPKCVKKALVLAKQTYDELVDQAEDKLEQKQDDIPTCAVHGVPMAKQSGKFGSFWSCHQRNPDGTFCSYRPTGR